MKTRRWKDVDGNVAWRMSCCGLVVFEKPVKGRAFCEMCERRGPCEPYTEAVDERREFVLSREMGDGSPPRTEYGAV